MICKPCTVNVRITAPEKKNYISPWHLNTNCVKIMLFFPGGAY